MKVEYIDGVSSIEEEDDEDDDAKTVTSHPGGNPDSGTGGKSGKSTDGKKDGDEEEVQVDTFRVIGIRRQPGECLVRM